MNYFLKINVFLLDSSKTKNLIRKWDTHKVTCLIFYFRRFPAAFHFAAPMT